ncbi:hypothetical protein J6P92_00825 [bacterium]|nr:hypothetical protein [bacterium]
MNIWLKKFAINTLKIIKSILKFIIMFPIYCMMPDKYNGVDYDEWSKK